MIWTPPGPEPGEPWAARRQRASGPWSRARQRSRRHLRYRSARRQGEGGYCLTERARLVIEPIRAVEIRENTKQREAERPAVGRILPTSQRSHDSLRNRVFRLETEAAYYITTATCLVALRPAQHVFGSSRFRL